MQLAAPKCPSILILRSLFGIALDDCKMRAHHQSATQQGQVAKIIANPNHHSEKLVCHASVASLLLCKWSQVHAGSEKQKLLDGRWGCQDLFEQEWRDESKQRKVQACATICRCQIDFGPCRSDQVPKGSCFRLHVIVMLMAVAQVNGEHYSGGRGPVDVRARGVITWSPDGRKQKGAFYKGWKICPKTAHVHAPIDNTELLTEDETDEQDHKVGKDEQGHDGEGKEETEGTGADEEESVPEDGSMKLGKGNATCSAFTTLKNAQRLHWRKRELKHYWLEMSMQETGAHRLSRSQGEYSLVGDRMMSIVILHVKPSCSIFCRFSLFFNVSGSPNRLSHTIRSTSLLLSWCCKEKEEAHAQGQDDAEEDPEDDWSRQMSKKGGFSCRLSE